MKRAISICMPYWNRPAELSRSLAAYARVYPDLDIEFSICDDGSMQPPVIPRGLNVRLTTLPQKAVAKNPCIPINRAVGAATREIIVLTNPEIEHREPVLLRMLDELVFTKDYVMTGCRNADATRGRDLLVRTGGDWIAGPGTPGGLTGGRQPIPAGTWLHFCVMFYRELFDAVGGFDEEYRNGSGCEDNDWLWKLYAHGVNFKYVPGTTWHYRTPHSWAGRPGCNTELLQKKWGHLPEFQACAS